jgi:dsRNA-specific ribonuclease
MKQVSVSNKTLGLIALFWGFDEFILIDHKESLK